MNAMSRSISFALLLLALSAATARGQVVAPPWAPTYSCQNGLNQLSTGCGKSHQPGGCNLRW